REVLLEAPLHRGPAGPGSGLAHKRRGANLELPTVATRLFRTVFRRRLLARFPQDRFPPRTPVVPDAAATVRGVARPPEPLSPPLEASVLRDLRPFAGCRIRAADKEESLDVYCGRLVARIIEDLVPFLHDSYEVHVDPEPYTVYCVSVTETPVRVFTTAWRREVTALLANDPRPDAISDEEVDDTWRNWFSYYQDDLVVLDWDAALVIEPSASYEDTLTVFELANLQLLELRTYDAFLDKVVDKAYDDLEDLFARSSLLRSGHDTVKELAEVRMDLA